MGCITKLLESGSKKVNAEYQRSAFVQGGGFYKEYEYLVTLNHHGYRCGYVAISKNHPLYNKEDCYDIDIEMHGSCTFFDKQLTASKCSDKWIGFDCAHSGDAPDLDALQEAGGDISIHSPRFSYEVIRDISYVEYQCKHIIDQLTGEPCQQ